jgi:tetratricopeptide (TPR) repeat protein
VEVEISNFRAALAWAPMPAASSHAYEELAAALWPYWQAHGSFFEGCVHPQAAPDRSAESESPERAELLRGAYALANGFHDRRTQLAARCVPDLGGLEEEPLWREDLGRARTVLEQALAMHRRLDQRPEVVMTLRCLRVVCSLEGDLQGTLAYIEEAVAIARELGSRIYLALMLHELGCILSREGAYEEARGPLAEALALFRQPGGERGIGFGCNNLAGVLVHLGEAERARQLYRDGLAYFIERENWDGIIWSLEGLAMAGIGEEDAANAARLLGAASALPAGSLRSDDALGRCRRRPQRRAGGGRL